MLVLLIMGEWSSSYCMFVAVDSNFVYIVVYILPQSAVVSSHCLSGALSDMYGGVSFLCVCEQQ